MKRALLFFVIIFGYFWMVGSLIDIYMADLYFINSKVFLSQTDFSNALTSIDKAIKSNENEPAYFRQRAKVLLGQWLLNNSDDKKTEVIKTLQKAEQLNSHNLATLRNSLPLYTLIGGDREYYARLKSTYANDLGLLVDIAKSERSLGLEDDYRVTKGLVSVLRPELLQWNEIFK